MGVTLTLVHWLVVVSKLHCWADLLCVMTFAQHGTDWGWILGIGSEMPLSSFALVYTRHCKRGEEPERWRNEIKLFAFQVLFIDLELDLERDRSEQSRAEHYTVSDARDARKRELRF